MTALLLWTLTVHFTILDALSCKQCNHKTGDDVEKCLKGDTRPEKCRNANHTHCVINFQRNVGDDSINVLWRKCGTVSDLSSCAVFDMNNVTKMNRKKMKVYYRSQASENKLTTPGFYQVIQVCSVDASACDNVKCLRKNYNTNPANNGQMIRPKLLYSLLMHILLLCLLIE